MAGWLAGFHFVACPHLCAVCPLLASLFPPFHVGWFACLLACLLACLPAGLLAGLSPALCMQPIGEKVMPKDELQLKHEKQTAAQPQKVRLSLSPHTPVNSLQQQLSSSRAGSGGHAAAPGHGAASTGKGWLRGRLGELTTHAHSKAWSVSFQASLLVLSAVAFVLAMQLS